MKLWVQAGLAATLFAAACVVSRDPKAEVESQWLFPIVPHPQEIRPKEGTQPFFINEKTRILIFSESGSEEHSAIRAINAALHSKNHPFLLTVNQEDGDLKNRIIILDRTTHGNFADSLLAACGLAFSEEYPGKEGYIMDVGPNCVIVVGHDSAGTFYGAQTLAQLIEGTSKSGPLEIKPVTIVDFPDMPLRSVFYGFYMNALEDDALIERAFEDFRRIAKYKFNMIDLSSHHYGHLQMQVPGHPGEKLWQRFDRVFQAARRSHLRPRVGGWAKWVNTSSKWGADLTTLESIRTTQPIRMMATTPCTLRVSSGHIAPNVIYDFESRESWDKEPVIVTDKTCSIEYREGADYVLNFGVIESENYQEHYDTAQTNLEVLFNKVHYGEGEPAGYPLRRGETFNLPTTIQRLAAGRIQDGQTVRVTFSYIGPDPWSLIKVRYCRSDPRLHNDGPDNYLWRWCTEPVGLLGADDFSLDVDETRVLAWDKRCLESGKSRSRIWADDIHYYYKTIRQADPKARISMWSDMLDPAHNASLYKTEKAISLITQYGMTDLILIPWKSSIAKESVRFFASNGFAIMPSCQNVTEGGFSEAPKWAKLIRDYYDKKDLPRGLMHCRWGYAFDKAATWEQLATVADHVWSVAPYILHSPVNRAISGREIKIVARFEGDRIVFDGKQIRKGPLPILDSFVYFKTNEDSSFKKIAMTEQNNTFEATIPASRVTGVQIEYYIAMSDKFNTSYCPKNADKTPFRIDIEAP